MGPDMKQFWPKTTPCQRFTSLLRFLPSTCLMGRQNRPTPEKHCHLKFEIMLKPCEPIRCITLGLTPGVYVCVPVGWTASMREAVTVSLSSDVHESNTLKKLLPPPPPAPSSSQRGPSHALCSDG